MNAFEAQLYGAFARMDAKKKRNKTGPKLGPNGKRLKRNICLTADVWAFLTHSGETASVAAETHVRQSATFKRWQKGRAVPTSEGKN